MFVPATWFLPLALSILWPRLLTWNFHNTWQSCSNTWNRFSSERFLILSGTFVYYFDKQTFPKLLAFTSHIYIMMSPLIFSILYCYNVAITFELEQFVKCLLFCSFTFSFVLFVCCVRLAACLSVQLLHSFKQHMVNKFLSEFKHFTRQLTICCLKFAAWSTMQFTFLSQLMRSFCAIQFTFLSQLMLSFCTMQFTFLSQLMRSFCTQF